jgi:DedD protein
MPPSPNVATTDIPPPDEVGLRPSDDKPQVVALDVPAPAPEVTVEIVDVTPAPESVKPAPAAPKSVQAARSEAPAALKIDADGVPIAWILQVASVSSGDKAEQLRGDLQRLNFKAFVKKIERADKALYRVYLGPKFERAKLEQLQPQINAEFKVKSMISRYVP